MLAQPEAKTLLLDETIALGRTTALAKEALRKAGLKNLKVGVLVQIPVHKRVHPKPVDLSHVDFIASYGESDPFFCSLRRSCLLTRGYTTLRPREECKKSLAELRALRARMKAISSMTCRK